MVGEIDTTPLEPVRNAVSLYGDKADQNKIPPTWSKRDYEKEIEDLKNELSNYKVQLEAKHVAHMQALLKPEHNQKRIHELSTLLKNSDIQRNKHVDESSESRATKDELKSKMKELSDLKLETTKVKDQLSHVLSELKATQRELLNKDTEIFTARDSELEALTKAQQLENALKMEKEQKEELLQQVKELSEVVHWSKLAAIKAEKVKLGMLSEKDEKFQLAINDSHQLNINEIELMETKIMDQSVYIERFETEMNRLKKELTSAKEERNALNINNESLTRDLHRAKEELNMTKERDIEAQVEIALLKSQLQEYRPGYKNEIYCTDIQTKGGGAEERTNNSEKNDGHITISLVDYNYLVREAEKGNEKASHESELKKELENATVKISELRARAEQALSRAELAENGKAALEEKIRRRREHRQRRKAAITALREECTPKPFAPSTSHVTYQPLGKVLNMKL